MICLLRWIRAHDRVIELTGTGNGNKSVLLIIYTGFVGNEEKDIAGRYVVQLQLVKGGRSADLMTITTVKKVKLGSIG